MLPSHLRGRRLSVSPPVVTNFAGGPRVRPSGVRPTLVIALVMLSDVTPPVRTILDGRPSPTKRREHAGRASAGRHSAR
jgi:hypothetical protein